MKNFLQITTLLINVSLNLGMRYVLNTGFGESIAGLLSEVNFPIIWFDKFFWSILNLCTYLRYSSNQNISKINFNLNLISGHRKCVVCYRIWWIHRWIVVRKRSSQSLDREEHCCFCHCDADLDQLCRCQMGHQATIFATRNSCSGCNGFWNRKLYSYKRR